MKKLLLLLVAFSAITIGVCSCKAWRTVTTSATYTYSSPQSSSQTLSKGEEASPLRGDGREVVTITTKTVEEYQGTRRK